MDSVTSIERILKRDRIIVGLGLTGVTTLSWIYMFNMLGSMELKTCCITWPYIHVWNALDLAIIFIMWTVMMVAMMLPSVSPLVLMFAAINRKRGEHGHSLAATGVFLLGYLIAWTGFSALAALAQWGLHTATLLSTMMVINNRIAGGALLLAAGVFQWTPLKYACLTRCRSPLGFLMNEWREGTGGAMVMGLKHGIYCIGCCWLLMGLMFVVGAMDLLWMAIITVFVLLEKMLPEGFYVSRASGLLLIVWGTWMAGGTLF